jgi:hypothetical protein
MLLLDILRKDSLHSAACKEHDPLQFLVVKEIIEAPQAPGLREWIRVQVRIVAVNVALIQLNFIFNCCPQWNLQALVLLSSDRRQI